MTDISQTQEAQLQRISPLSIQVPVTIIIQSTPQRITVPKIEVL